MSFFRGRQFLRFLCRKNKTPALLEVFVFLKKGSCIVRFLHVWFVACRSIVSGGWYIINCTVCVMLFQKSQIQNCFAYSGFELLLRI